MFIEALILKAPDVKALYTGKIHRKALFLQALSLKTKSLFLQTLKQRTFSSIEIEKLQVHRKKAWQKTEVKEIEKV